MGDPNCHRIWFFRRLQSALLAAFASSACLATPTVCKSEEQPFVDSCAPLDDEPMRDMAAAFFIRKVAFDPGLRVVISKAAVCEDRIVFAVSFEHQLPPHVWFVTVRERDDKTEFSLNRPE